MKILEMLYRGLSTPGLFGDLGDRATYIGASDIGQCPRKVVLSKQEETAHDLATLIKFARGHLAENIVAIALKAVGQKFQTQVEVGFEVFKAHLDFVFGTPETPTGVMEVKSVSTMPTSPWDSWIDQLTIQVGLLMKAGWKKVRPSNLILAMNLNTGELEGFPVEFDQPRFEALLEKGRAIWACVEDPDCPPRTERGPLCSWCIYRPDCPAYSTEGLPEVEVETEAVRFVELKEQEKLIQTEIGNLGKRIKTAMKSAFPDAEAAAARAGDITIKVGFRSRTFVDSKGLQKVHPEIYEKYSRVSTYEVLTVE